MSGQAHEGRIKGHTGSGIASAVSAEARGVAQQAGHFLLGAASSLGRYFKLSAGERKMAMKRPSGELELPSTPPDQQLTSSRGRIVKPRTWEDGAEAPLALAGSRLQRTTTPKQELSSPDSDMPAIAAARRPVSAGAVPLGLGLSMNMNKRGTVPVRDETGRFTGVRPKTAAERLQKAANGGGGIFKTAAAEILRAERRLMSTGEIARLAMKRGLINCNGKTPDATMASALYTDLKRRDVNSIFIRPHEGLFGLREWTTEENGHFEGRTDSGHLYVMDPTDILSTGARGMGSSPLGFELTETGQQDAAEGDGDDDEAHGSGFEGVTSGPPGFSPLLPPRHLKRPRNAPARSGQTPAGLPNWGRSNLSRAASTGVVDGPTTKMEPTARSRSMGKHGAGSEGENGNIMLLLDAAQELHRSSSGDEGNDIEPSTAGTGIIGGAVKDDARSRKPGLRQAPPKSRKLQEPENGDTLANPPSPKNGDKRKRALSGASLAAAMANHQHVLFDDEGVGRSPRSVAAKARYANSSQQAIAARAEQQGLLIEGFNASRLAREQAKLPNAGKGLHNEQVNILNLPMPDFDVTGEGDMVAIPVPLDSAAKAASASEDAAEAGEPAGSQVQSGESGSLPPVGPEEPGNKDKVVMEWSNNQLLRLEESLAAMEQQIGSTHPHLGQMHLTLGIAFQSAGADGCNMEKAQQHLNQAKKIWEAHAPKDGYNAGSEFSYLLSKAQKLGTIGTLPISMTQGGQPTLQLPASAGVSPVPTPVVNPPLPYSLLGAQGSGAAMSAPQPPAWLSAAVPGGQLPPPVPASTAAQLPAGGPSLSSAFPAPAVASLPPASSAAAVGDAVPAMVQTSA